MYRAAVQFPTPVTRWWLEAMFAEEENVWPSPTKSKEIKLPVLIMRRISSLSMESVPFIFILINSSESGHFGPGEEYSGK